MRAEPRSPTTDAAASAAAEYVSARTEGAVYRTTVDRARTILEADSCSILVAEGYRFSVRASAPADSIRTPDDLSLSTEVLEETSSSGNVHVIDDLSDVRSSAASAPSVEYTDDYRSLLIVPDDTVGLFVAADRRPAWFSRDDAGALETHLTNAGLALDRIRAQSRRNARGERLEEIVGTFAHDLRAPLQVASGHLELARETDDERHFERAANAHDRMAELVADMSRLATTGKHVDDRQPVDLERTAVEAWLTVPTGDATLDVVETTSIEADESRLRQLLENLFNNAVEHGSGDVAVRAGTFDGGFFVEDDGDGIPTEHHEDVFRWQTTSADGHAGLGLSIVRGIVDAHGWDISVTEGTAGGSRFEISV